MNRIRFFQSIQVKLIVIYVLLILIAMQLIGVYFVRTVEQSLMTGFRASLINQANLIGEYAKPYLNELAKPGDQGQTRNARDLIDIAPNFYQVSGAEIQIIDANGIVRSSSHDDTIIGQKTIHPEIIRVLNGIPGEPLDVVDELGMRSQLFVQPVKQGTSIIGAVYVFASIEELYKTIDNINRIFIAGTLIALVLTVMLGIIISRTMTHPIKEITKTASAIAEGNFNRKLEVEGHDEIGQLGQAFNHMTYRLREALTSIEEEKDKLASILSSMSDGVIATDETGKVILINQRAQAMLQCEPGDVENKPIAQLLQLDESVFGEEGLLEPKVMLLKLQPDQDEPLTVRAAFTPIFRRGSGISGTIIVLHDVTEQEKLERSLRDFVANVSHELRTPLTTINSYLEALHEGALNDPELANQFIDVTRNETERMIRLVSDLLLLSRLDYQKEMHKEWTDIAELIDEVTDRFSYPLLQKNIEIVTQTVAGLKPLWVDRNQIDQVLDNLVSNAIKYTPEGGTIHITAVPDAKTGFMKISVKDTGIGIPKKDLERVFERFYRVDKARSRSMGGTGLGLSIAREIIRAHGGTIWAKSRENEGSEFIFTLPMQGPEANTNG